LCKGWFTLGSSKAEPSQAERGKVLPCERSSTCCPRLW